MKKAFKNLFWPCALVFVIFFSQPIFAEKQYPIFLKFKETNAKDAEKILIGVEVPEKIEGGNPDMPSISQTFIPSYSIAQYDLDEDGVKEIFLYTSSPGMCGSAGCDLKVYKLNNNKMLNILGEPSEGIITDIKISILKNMTKNYHDILLEQNAVWKWNGTKYEFAKKP